MNPRQADLHKKQKRVKCIINVVNAYFFVQVAAWAGFMFGHAGHKDGVRMYKV
jgi:hypothetical protein